MQGYQDPQAWYSRVAKSASNLTHDLLDGSYETTADLATLRTAHKVGYNHQTGQSGFAERHRPKLLSQRHRVNGGLKSPARHSAEDLLNDLEVEEEIVQFLGRQCVIEQQSNAGSSRSASPLSGDEGSSKLHGMRGENVPRPSNEQSEDGADGMFAGPILDQSVSPLDLDSNARSEEQHTQPPYPTTTALREQLATTLTPRESTHFDTTRWDHHFTAKEEAATSTTLDQETPSSRSQDRLKQQASRRLQLISEHLAAHALAQQAAASVPVVRARDYAFESSYNQVCHGEISQEWADFQAVGSFCFKRDVQQYSTPYSQLVQQPLQQGGMQRGIDAMERLGAGEGLKSQIVAEREEKDEQEPEPLPDFHCPWVGCHLHLEHGSQYVRNAEGGLESLACVHEGCDEAFVEEADWREHIMCAHHGILRTPRSETPVNSEEFERAWGERKSG